MPNVEQAALDIEGFGADGITVHPRPDARHIRYEDVYRLKEVLRTELNVEGNPTPDFIEMVMDVCPAQVTLVPDAPDAITSNAGWDTTLHHDFLVEVTRRFQSRGIRVSVFVDPVMEMVEGAKAIGVDRIELYTESFAAEYSACPERAIESYARAARVAHEAGLGINAGHDLSLENLQYFVETIPYIDEVSIGHALICDALYMGLERTVAEYQKQLGK